jgi:hypothetical protein
VIDVHGPQDELALVTQASQGMQEHRGIATATEGNAQGSV